MKEKEESAELWFDVGIKRYTTMYTATLNKLELWFDVGIKRYTTLIHILPTSASCGLMQESKDIQPYNPCATHIVRCGLMQESKDIQQASLRERERQGCGLMQESKDIQHAEIIRFTNFVVV